MKSKALRTLRFILVLFLISFAFSHFPQAGVYAQGLEKQAVKQECKFVKIIPHFQREKDITKNGFHIDLFGTGELDFTKDKNLKYATLSLAPDPTGEYNAARITEVDTSIPPEDRLKCWQPTAKKDVLVEYTVRFGQAENPGLTENLILWNAPIGEQQALPFTLFGVTRNMLFPGYVAFVAQDFDFMSPTPTGVIQYKPLPNWLDPTDWHTVRIQLSQQRADIAVAQGNHDFESVLSVDLPAPVEPLAFEFSLDNEVVPGVFAPVFGQDSLDIQSLLIRYTNNK